MTTKTAVKWYIAKEAKKGRTIHLAGHARLGSKFSKCGKTLGRQITDAFYFSPCAACAIEQNKEIEREKKRVEMERKAPAVEAAACEFCDIDGMGNHAPRCPEFLEKRIAKLDAALLPFAILKFGLPISGQMTPDGWTNAINAARAARS